MVNELLIQMQSFDQPRLRERMRGKMHRVAQRLPPDEPAVQVLGKPDYHNILLIAATNRAEVARPRAAAAGAVRPAAVLRSADQAGRADLIDYFLGRKAHDPQLDDPEVRDRGSRTILRRTRR